MTTTSLAASPPANATTIRQLNDTLRCFGSGGITQLSRGVRALPSAHQRDVLAAVARFDGFSPDSDPYTEHDCATLDVGSTKIIWKIDYYDRSLRAGSDDPSDPAVTTRVLTIMLAEEY